MRFIGLKNCDTCRRALRALAAAGIAPDVTDVRTDGIAEADQEAIIAAFGAAAINRASTTWRGLSEAEKAGDPKALLTAHALLLKRPAIYADGVWTLGWKADVAAFRLGD